MPARASPVCCTSARNLTTPGLDYSGVAKSGAATHSTHATGVVLIPIQLGTMIDWAAWMLLYQLLGHHTRSGGIQRICLSESLLDALTQDVSPSSCEEV